MAEEQGFEPWVGYKPTPVFKTGALNHSATPPNAENNISIPLTCKPQFLNIESNAQLMFTPMFFTTNTWPVSTNNRVNRGKNTYTVRDLSSWYGKITATFHGKCLYEFTLDTHVFTRI